jgi:hypothetical protein
MQRTGLDFFIFATIQTVSDQDTLNIEKSPDDLLVKEKVKTAVENQVWNFSNM